MSARWQKNISNKMIKNTSKPQSPSKIRARREILSTLLSDEIPTRDESSSAKLNDRRASITVNGRRASIPVTGRRTSSPVTGRRASSPVTGRRASSPEDGRRASSPVTGRRASSPVDGRQTGSPTFNRSDSKSVTPFKQTNNSVNTLFTQSSQNARSGSSLKDNQYVPLSPKLSISTSWGEPSSESFAVVSRNIYNLWHNQELCDVKIYAGGRQFLVHKVVMASSCGLFAKEKEERSTPLTDIVEILEVSADAMSDVLKYFYTHRLHISGHNVDSLLKIAKDLKIPVITEKCKEYLKGVCLQNVVQNRFIAQKYGLSDVIAHIDLYFRENFQELSSSPSFLQSEFQLVFDIVSSDVFYSGSELEVFQACATWIDFSRQERLKYAVPLMALIKFTKIPAEKLVSDVEIVQYIFDIPDCKDMLYHAFKYHALVRDYIAPTIESNRQSSSESRRKSKTPEEIKSAQMNQSESTNRRHSVQQPQEVKGSSSQNLAFDTGSSSSEKQTTMAPKQTTSQPILARPHSSHSVRASRDEIYMSRSSSKADEQSPTEVSESSPSLPFPPSTQYIFVAGGMNNFDVETTGGILQTLQQYDPKTNCWTGRTQLPSDIYNCGLALLDGYVYVIGGSLVDPHKTETEVTAQCHRYDVVNDKWEAIAKMLTPRAEFAVVVLHNVIYSVGGVDNMGRSLSSMEFYSAEENKWHYTSSMNEMRIGLAASGHRDHVFVVGGFDWRPDNDKLLLDSVAAYDPATDQWEMKADFPLHVSHASLVDVSDVLYLVGGYVTCDGHNILSLNNIFRYRDDADTWESFMTLHVPRHDATVVTLDSNLYVIGGTSSATIGHALSNVECINVETEEHIEGIAPLPTSAYGLRGCADTWDF